MFQAGQAFAVSDSGRGMQLWTSAMQEMKRAVALRPNDVAVRIPRGAVMLASYPYIADAPTRELHVRQASKTTNERSSFSPATSTG